MDPEGGGELRDDGAEVAGFEAGGGGEGAVVGGVGEKEKGKEGCA